MSVASNQKHAESEVKSLERRALYGGLDDGPRPETRAQVAAALERGVDPLVVVDHVARGVDTLVTDIERLDLPGEEPLACTKGCSYCCHQRVELTAPEVLLIARSVRESAERRSRVAETARRLGGQDARTHHLAQVRCALLDENGACSVYASRPLACRRAHSTDVGICEAAHRKPTLEVLVPSSTALWWNISALVLGYYEGSALGGHPPHIYELHAALHVALEDSDVEARFRRGEDPFASVRARHADDLFDVFGRAGPRADGEVTPGTKSALG
jgi:Fe-S-cluster containining protein